MTVYLADNLEGESKVFEAPGWQEAEQHCFNMEWILIGELVSQIDLDKDVFTPDEAEQILYTLNHEYDRMH